VVFQGADNNVIARLELVLQAIGQKVQRRRGTVGENDLPALASIEPLRHFVAGVFEGLGRVGARQVLGPVHIGCAIGVVVRQCVEQGLGFLRGCSAVQIGLGLTLQGGDGGEVSAPGRRQKHGVRLC